MNFGAIIEKKKQDTENFKQQKAAEREELSAMGDAAIRAVTQQPEAYLHYLDVQANNPGFSVSNVLLAMQQCPDVVFFNTVEGWNKLGRSVISGAAGFKIRVSDPYVKDGRTYRGYKIGRAFEETQTKGSRVTIKTVLTDDTPEMELAMRALLYKCPVEVKAVKDADFDACYDPQSKTIYVSETTTDSRIFAAFTREIFRAMEEHNNGRYAGRSREETELDANSAAYMLCRNYGIPCEKPDASRVAALYEGMEPQDARGCLDSIQRVFRELHDAVQKELAPQQEERRYRYSQPTK